MTALFTFSIPLPKQEVIKLIKALAFGQLCQLFFVEKIHSGMSLNLI